MPALIRTLQDPNSDIREYSAYTVGRIGEGAVNAMPVLIQALQDENTGVRISAIWALGSIGVGAKDAVPAITKLLLDKDRDIRLNAVNALGNIGSEDGVPALNKGIGKTRGGLVDSGFCGRSIDQNRNPGRNESSRRFPPTADRRC